MIESELHPQSICDERETATHDSGSESHRTQTAEQIFGTARGDDLLRDAPRVDERQARQQSGALSECVSEVDVTTHRLRGER